MSRRNYSKAPDGTTLFARFRFANETVRESKNLTDAVDKDASTFSLATPKTILASLRSLYHISEDEEKKFLFLIKKTS